MDVLDPHFPVNISQFTRSIEAFMNLPDLSNRPALWLGLRQAEALREALNLSLNGKARPSEAVAV